MEVVMELTGCGPREAAAALAEHKEIWLAVDALLPTPVPAGAKHIPARPLVDPGMSEEQKERCDRGRWLQDQVNAVFSVAHSKSQTLPVQSAVEAPTSPPQELLTAPPVSLAQSPSTTSSSPGSVEKSLQ